MININQIPWSSVRKAGSIRKLFICRISEIPEAYTRFRRNNGGLLNL